VKAEESAGVSQPKRRRYVRKRAIDSGTIGEL
jgi:hypothetical protein